MKHAARSRILAVALAAGLPVSAFAQGASESAPKAVVELFTSQGCASCPPADERLVELSKDPDVIALTLPVDYWDYLGWEDTLADPAHSARQRNYASVRGDRMVFTPQMVVNGEIACIGSKPDEVASALEEAREGDARLAVPVFVAVTAGEAEIRVGEGAGAPAEVWLLAVDASEEVAIGRGENSGRHAQYANVVRDMVRVGDWTGAAQTFRAAASGPADFHVVLVQRGDTDAPGAILGAARSDER